MHIIPVRCYEFPPRNGCPEGRSRAVYFRRMLFAFRLNIVFMLRFVASAAFCRELCLCCGKETLVLPLCRSCLSKLFSFAALTQSPVRCRICGKELVSEQELCSSCREKTLLVHTDGVYPIHPYRLWKKEILFAWKIEEKRALSPVLASLVHKALAELEPVTGKSCPVVPVPPRPGKIREKGWDQIDELCSFLHRGFGTNVLKLLVRRSHLQQKKLDRVQRLGTIGSSYAAVPKRRIKGPLPESVIILDDVMTTGATIETCAALLKGLGIKRVYAVTLFCVD